jgi:F-box domain
MPPGSQNNNINDLLPEEALCLVIGQVDFWSKAAVLRVCKKWYRLLTYPPQVRKSRLLRLTSLTRVRDRAGEVAHGADHPSAGGVRLSAQGSGVWGTLPLNLMRLHMRVDGAQLEWLARRAAGFAGISIHASSDQSMPRIGPNGQLMSNLDPGTDIFGRPRAPPYRLTHSRHFADMTLVTDLPQECPATECVPERLGAFWSLPLPWRPCLTFNKLHCHKHAMCRRACWACCRPGCHLQACLSNCGAPPLSTAALRS